jgi:N-acetylmuramoyl-L-alanine amidase
MTSAPKFHGRKELMRSNILSSVSDPRAFGKRLMMVFASAVLLSGCETPSKDTSRTFKTVVIDAGHGGHDSGARSRSGGQEKNNTLSVALKLDSKLRAAGFQTVLTRKGDYFVTLDQRANISNQQSNAVFVSIHFNDARRRRVSGAEVYYKTEPSRAIAQRILANLGALPGLHARYMKTANFHVLRMNRYPAVLVECGYLSNRKEGRLSASQEQHERLASAIAKSLIEQRGLAVPAAATVPAARVPAARVPTAKVPAAKVPAAKVPAAKVPAAARR